MKLIKIIGLVLLFIFNIHILKADSSSLQPEVEKKNLVDTIINNVISSSPIYAKKISSYNAKLYIKGKMNIPKKNFGLRYIPKMFHLKKNVRDYIFESFNELHYTAPNIYDQQILASYGTTYGNRFQSTMLEYFHVNIYSSTLLYNKILSPLAKNARRYYQYKLDSTFVEDSTISYKVRFIPKTKSDQLVGGWMVVSSHSWSIREIRLFGRTDFVKFENYIIMGDVGAADELLPIRYELNAYFAFLGNKVDGSYLASLDYDNIEEIIDIPKKKISQHSYDLSESYILQCNKDEFRGDSAYFDSIRPIPLSEKERQLYIDYASGKDTIQYIPHKKNKALWGSVGDFLLTDIKINLNNIGDVRCSPIINPLLLSYSKSNGFSWRQDFRFNRLFVGDKLLRIRPRIGYNFTRKEFYWSVYSNFDYWPQKQATVHLNFGNGNRIYSSDVLDDLKAIPDSVFDFNQIHLDYFKDLFFNIRHSIEVVNGVNVEVGLYVHRRTPIKKTNLEILDPSYELPPDVISKVRNSYISFAPNIKLSWTPYQYYYMNGNRKVNLYSKFPTASFQYERAIRGVFGSRGQYEKIEFDLQHKINLNLMRSLFYRVGFGFFTNQKEMYFVDFSNFTRSNLPHGWNDDIGGVFQLLDGRWYNSSDKYLRGHVTYEAPFLFMRHLMKYLRYVQNERIYLNLLVVPHLNPYFELGYGIGTHIFDFGVFVGFANWIYNEIGCKFTFELFNR